ncbi:MAG TPA: hypothetical protein VMB81_15730 [Candidatus Sulfotelmatobacter sp.]|nr:hypothetical protein [Candidatus Sulfotelmatobacter sp.]
MAGAAAFGRPRHEVCFGFATKDRVDVTLQSIASFAFEGAFDLIWLDGSTTREGRELPRTLAPNMPCLREIIDDVRGGPDVAIVTALTRMLALDYAYCGLIESDIAMAPGWFGALMALFGAGEADGLAVGAVTVRAFEQRVLVKRPGYAILLMSGAGMILFTRAAARLILDHYRTPSTDELRSWFLYASGRDCATFAEAAFRLGPHADVALASDYQYEVVLQRHGLCTLATSPLYARDLAAGGVRPDELGGYATALATAADPASTAVFEALRTRLQAQRQSVGSAAGSQRAPGAYLFSRAMGGWVVFLHQLLFTVGSAARLIGRWQISWSKFHGPFLFETDDPAAALELPVMGALRGLGCVAAVDGAPIALDDGARTAAVLATRGDGRRPFYALETVAQAGAGPMRIRPAGPGWLRLFAVCFAEPQPWLPASPSLDADRLVRCFEAQAARGCIN